MGKAVETTALERELTRKVEFLREVLERLQDAFGLLIEAEAIENNNGYDTDLIFKLTLKNKLWQEAKHYRRIRDAILDMVAYKIDQMLEERNGKDEKIDLSYIKPSEEPADKDVGGQDRRGILARVQSNKKTGRLGGP